jgi:heptosyltransferase II
MRVEDNFASITYFENNLSNNVCPATLSTDHNPNFKQNRFKQFLRNIFIKLHRTPPVENYSLPENPKCIIFCSGSNLGGAIISLPLIEAVRKKWPDSHLAVLSNTEQGIEIIKYAGFGDSFHLIPNVSFINFYFNEEIKVVLKSLQSLDPEILISNHDFHLDYLLIPLRIPYRIGSTEVSVSGKLLVWSEMYNFKVKCREGQNWIESYSEIAKLFQNQSLSFPGINISENDKIQARLTLSELGLPEGKNTIAVQASVWNQQRFKQWPTFLLAAALKQICNETDLVPVVFGAIGQETSLVELREILPEIFIINLIGKTTVSQAAAIISQCSVSITNDSGLMHLSAAVGTPTVAIYGMTNPSITWVYGHNFKHRIVRRSDCRPCYTLDETILNNCTNRVCLTSVYPDTVAQAVISLVKTK